MKRILFLLCFLPILTFGQYRADRARTNPNVTDGNGYCFRGHLPATGETYCAEATALFAQITDWGTLSAAEIVTRKEQINTLIIDLKADNIWQTRDRIWVGAMPSEQSAAIEWKGTADNLVKVLSPDFQADSGWKSDGSGYYTTTYVPANGPNYTLNDAGIEIYMLTTETTLTLPSGIYQYRTPEKEYGAALNYCYSPTYGAPVSLINNNNPINGVWTATKVGLFSSSRIHNDTIYHYVNGVLNTKVYLAKTYVPDQPIYLCAYHNWFLGTSSAGGFSLRRFSLVMYGSSLTDTQELALKVAFEKYMDAIGTGVIP